MIIALLAAALALPASAATYAEAKAAYDSGDFQKAAAAFAPLSTASPGDAALHYDLGNALLKSGKLGLASASYQRAFDLDPRDGDGRHNRNFRMQGVHRMLLHAWTLGFTHPVSGASVLVTARKAQT